MTTLSAGVILLSGPIGAGKTTVAAEIVRQTASSLIYIEGDKFWSYIAKPHPNEEQNKRLYLIMRAMTAAATPFVRGGYSVLIDFSFPPDFLKVVMAQRRKSGVAEPLHYIVLRPSIEVCAARAKNREDGKIDDYTAYQDFYKQFIYDDEKTLGGDGMDPAAVAEEIIQGVKTGRFVVS
jgi:predicted ABC-type ATPase